MEGDFFLNKYEVLIAGAKVHFFYFVALFACFSFCVLAFFYLFAFFLFLCINPRSARGFFAEFFAETRICYALGLYNHGLGVDFS